LLLYCVGCAKANFYIGLFEQISYPSDQKINKATRHGVYLFVAIFISYFYAHSCTLDKTRQCYCIIVSSY
jgi:hypothetical protein